MSSHTSLTEWEVRNMLELGVEHGVVVDLLVETGDWSQSGANEIVPFMTRGPDGAHDVVAAATTQAHL